MYNTFESNSKRIFFFLYRYIYVFFLPLHRLLRIAVLQSAVSIKLEDVVKPAKSLFDDWMLKGKRIAPNIRNVVYIAGNYLFFLFTYNCPIMEEKYTDWIYGNHDRNQVWR